MVTHHFLCYRNKTQKFDPWKENLQEEKSQLHPHLIIVFFLISLNCRHRDGPQ